jgi:hypothetical protein
MGDRGGIDFLQKLCSAYAAFVKFFSEEIEKNGVTGRLGKICL